MLAVVDAFAAPAWHQHLVSVQLTQTLVTERVEGYLPGEQQLQQRRGTEGACQQPLTMAVWLCAGAPRGQLWL
jgi:hypothetical protein